MIRGMAPGLSIFALLNHLAAGHQCECSDYEHTCNWPAWIKISAVEAMNVSDAKKTYRPRRMDTNCPIKLSSRKDCFTKLQKKVFKWLNPLPNEVVLTWQKLFNNMLKMFASNIYALWTNLSLMSESAISGLLERTLSICCTIIQCLFQTGVWSIGKLISPIFRYGHMYLTVI